LNSKPKLGLQDETKFSGSISIACLISHQIVPLNGGLKLSISNGRFVLPRGCTFQYPPSKGVYLNQSRLPHDWDIIMVNRDFEIASEARILTELKHLGTPQSHLKESVEAPWLKGQAT
jgi:hypothetical protein